MNENLDDRIDSLRSPRPLGRLAVTAIAVGVLTVALSGGVLAYGAVQSTADENRAIEAARRLDAELSAQPVAAHPPASPEVPQASPDTPQESAPPTYPVYDADTDVSTIDLSGIPEWDSIDNARIWLQQQAITADCMAAQGYHYTFRPYWERDPTSGAPTSQFPPGSAAWYALWGSENNIGDAYRWEDAGCDGLAVHETGMDDAH